MFKVNDLIIHNREGLSRISAINSMNGKDYFLVNICRNSDENYYVPVETADKIIRPLMNAKTADDLLIYIRSIEKSFNTNTKQRRDAYKRLLSSGEVKDIAYLYKQLYFFNRENDGAIKLGPVDLEMLCYAKDMLMDELAISYNIKREEIEGFVERRIS